MDVGWMLDGCWLDGLWCTVIAAPLQSFCRTRIAFVPSPFHPRRCDFCPLSLSPPCGRLGSAALSRSPPTFTLSVFSPSLCYPVICAAHAPRRWIIRVMSTGFSFSAALCKNSFTCVSADMKDKRHLPPPPFKSGTYSCYRGGARALQTGTE